MAFWSPFSLGLDGVHTPIKPTREEKGKSLLDFLDDFIVVDLETTGFDPQYDEVIEIGAIKVVGGVVVSEFSMLVKPKSIISDFISELTGITNDMVRNESSIHEVLPEFLHFIGNDVVLGHNVNFDVNFIYDKCVMYSLPVFANNFIDTLRLTRRIFKDLQYYRLDKIADALSIKTAVTHRALSDCHVTLDIYNYLRSHVSDNNIDFSALVKKPTAKDITTDNTSFDESHPLFGMVCVFTGTLDKLPRKETMQIVTDLGGKCADNVTKKTNYLILGASDYSKIKDGKSTKQRKAKELRLQGLEIETISENVFYDMVMSVG